MAVPMYKMLLCFFEDIFVIYSAFKISQFTHYSLNHQQNRLPTHPGRTRHPYIHVLLNYHPPILPRNHSHIQSPIHPVFSWLFMNQRHAFKQWVSKENFEPGRGSLGWAIKVRWQCHWLQYPVTAGKAGADDVAAKTKRQVHRWPTVARGDVGWSQAVLVRRYPAMPVFVFSSRSQGIYSEVCPIYRTY